MRKPVLFIVGPTASGKTKAALLLAEKYQAEIISADSRQIYKFMDIGTAKPTQEERKLIKHHFIDEKNPEEDFSAGDFGIDGRVRINMIVSKGKNIIVAGGSGLYISALLDGISNIPYNEEIREKLSLRLEKEGSDVLWKQLKGVDPESAQVHDATKTQRVIRALEVYLATGKTMTQWQKEEKPQPFPFPYVIVGLESDRDVLYDRINQRVNDMITAGLEKEARQLLSRGFDLSCNSMRTVGYAEWFELFDNRWSREKVAEKIKQHSRNYAKRQMTWFKRDERILWVSPESPQWIDQIDYLWLRPSSIKL